jgi:hypothetical protein
MRSKGTVLVGCNLGYENISCTTFSCSNINSEIRNLVDFANEHARTYVDKKRRKKYMDQACWS